MVGWRECCQVREMEEISWKFDKPVELFHLRRIYIELSKVGDKPETPELSNDQLKCEFEERGVDIILKQYKGANFRLKLTNLREKIVTGESTCKCVKNTRLIITLKKQDASTKWWDLIEKKWSSILQWDKKGK